MTNESDTGRQAEDLAENAVRTACRAPAASTGKEKGVAGKKRGKAVSGLASSSRGAGCPPGMMPSMPNGIIIRWNACQRN